MHKGPGAQGLQRRCFNMAVLHAVHTAMPSFGLASAQSAQPAIMARGAQGKGKPANGPKGKAPAQKRKAADAAPAAEQRQVRRRAAPAEKEALQPIEHESHSRVRRRRHCCGCRAVAQCARAPTLACRSLERCLSLATATAGSSAWGRTSPSGCAPSPSASTARR